MMELLGQITLSEVTLFFILLFILPGMAIMLARLRRYEREFGLLPPSEKKAAKAAPAKPQPKEGPPPEPAGNGADANVFPYREKTFLGHGDLSCLAALRQALGPEVEVYPRVALWETVESTDPVPGYKERLWGKDLDYLVCDRATGRVLVGVLYQPGKGRPAGPRDEVEKICAAAGIRLVSIAAAEEYDPARLKNELGIPELEL